MARNIKVKTYSQRYLQSIIVLQNASVTDIILPLKKTREKLNMLIQL